MSDASLGELWDRVDPAEHVLPPRPAGRVARMPDGRPARVDGQPACRLAGCCYTARVAGELCERHARAAWWRRWSPVEALAVAR